MLWEVSALGGPPRPLVSSGGGRRLQPRRAPHRDVPYARRSRGAGDAARSTTAESSVSRWARSDARASRRAGRPTIAGSSFTPAASGDSTSTFTSCRPPADTSPCSSPVRQRSAACRGCPTAAASSTVPRREARFPIHRRSTCAASAGTAADDRRADVRRRVLRRARRALVRQGPDLPDPRSIGHLEIPHRWIARREHAQRGPGDAAERPGADAIGQSRRNRGRRISPTTADTATCGSRRPTEPASPGRLRSSAIRRRRSACRSGLRSTTASRSSSAATASRSGWSTPTAATSVS